MFSSFREAAMQLHGIVMLQAALTGPPSRPRHIFAKDVAGDGGWGVGGGGAGGERTGVTIEPVRPQCGLNAEAAASRRRCARPEGAVRGSSTHPSPPLPLRSADFPSPATVTVLLPVLLSPHRSGG